MILNEADAQTRLSRQQAFNMAEGCYNLGDKS